MRYSIKVEWQLEDGRQTGIEVGQLDVGACQKAADVGLKLDEVKPLLARRQEVVMMVANHLPNPASRWRQAS